MNMNFSQKVQRQSGSKQIQQQHHQQQQLKQSHRTSRSSAKLFTDTASSASFSSSASSSDLKDERKQESERSPPLECRGIKKLIRLIKNLEFDRSTLSNKELVKLVKNQNIPIYQLENFLGKENAARCVEVRREFYKSDLSEIDKKDQSGIHDRAQALDNNALNDNLDYNLVNGACCENVIGCVKLPVGLAVPLILDGEVMFVPMATTEGCLVASTCRGLSALRKSGGVISRVRKDFMTRAPIIRFEDASLKDALDNVDKAIDWLEDDVNKEKMAAAFNMTTSHGRFSRYTLYSVAREIHIRFEAETGDAMGMNMCSKGVESALKVMQRAFPTMKLVTLSGNMCNDKKPSDINWINGRGKSVECNAELPEEVVEQVFKVSVDSIIDTWKSKVMVGSALAGSIGGFNCQAANIVAAIFIATGQDPAQIVTSSNCMLVLDKSSTGSLVACCKMPSIECGTVGGGTILGDQSRYLQLMGIKGSTPKTRQSTGATINNKLVNGNITASSSASTKGSTVSLSQSASINSLDEYSNARKLSGAICACVLAGELSLLSSLASSTLVKSHMKLNRSSTNIRPCDPF